MKTYCVFAAVVFCSSATRESAAQGSTTRTVHVFVALADNQYQGIVPVPPKLGNGDDPTNNLYWGAAAGVKTFFGRSPSWTALRCSSASTPPPKREVLERCIFKYRAADVYLVADAYRGREIQLAILDFLDAAAGASSESLAVEIAASTNTVKARGGANLVAYIGHDGLMDFSLPRWPTKSDEAQRDAIILACISQSYFAKPLRATGARPLLWTTGLMAPEAYTLESALNGWIAGETGAQIRERAAVAYDKYQKCGVRGARRLFASGW